MCQPWASPYPPPAPQTSSESLNNRTLDKRNGKTYAGPGVWTGKSYPERHLDAVAGCAWMQEQKDAGAIEDGWIVFAHVERDGAWTADGGGYNVEHFRDFNNAGPDVCFGFEGAPGHQTSKDRGGFGMSAFGGTPRAAPGERHRHPSGQT